MVLTMGGCVPDKRTDDGGMRACQEDRRWGDADLTSGLTKGGGVHDERTDDEGMSAWKDN